MSDIQIKEQSWLKNIKDFIANDKVYNYERYVKYLNTPRILKVQSMLEFAKTRLTENEYDKLVSKVYPLEPCRDGSDVHEKEDLKKKFFNLAMDVAYGRANLIDIVDALDGYKVGVLANYEQIVRQLTYNYKMLSIGYCKANIDYIIYVANYDEQNSILSVKFPNLADRQKKEINDVLLSRGLPINNTTVNAAYVYYMRNKQNNSR